MNEARELKVPVEACDQRLDSWLAGALELSRSAAVKLIEAGRVQVDGTTRARSFRLAGGESLSVEATAAAAPAPAGVVPALVFEDDSLLVVDKPAGLVVHPAPGHRNETLAELLARAAAGRYKPHLVHRLDRDTSGLVVVAKDEATQQALQEQLRERKLTREYLALVAGRPRSRSGTIDAPIGRDRKRRTQMSTATDKPRAAVTHFEVEQQFGSYSLLRVRLETGRTHQIRAHLSAIGLAVAGDSEYGGKGMLGLERQFLHSTRLGLLHPASGEAMEWQSELPEDLALALARAGERC